MSKYTKTRIMDAFLYLLNEKSMDRLTVKDVIETAEVNRNTFYYHFEDIYDLLHQVLKRKLDDFSNDTEKYLSLIHICLLTNSMGVEGQADPTDIVAAVEAAGYGAEEKSSGNQTKSSTVSTMEEQLKDKETPVLKKRLIASLCFLLPLMYVSMGHMMWGWPLPELFAENHVAVGLFQMLMTVIIMVINQKFFISGFKSLLHRSPNMDTLVAVSYTHLIPYMTNVTAKKIETICQTKELLKTQISAPVLWMQSMEQMIEDGVDTFIEIGPGRTLAGFLKKINREVTVYNISTWEEMEAVAEKMRRESEC